MLSVTRRNKIVEILKKENQITTQQLGEILGVSGATVRKDLQELENQGILRRIHGGAVLAAEYHQSSSYKDFHHRSQKNVEAKKAIGREAAQFISKGKTFFLDASSTVLHFVPYFRGREGLTIVTNGLYTALDVKEIGDINVIVTGGIVRPQSGALEGLLGESILSIINADIMFTSAHGFNIKDGLTDFNVYEVELKRKMVSKSKKIIALLDHSKLGYTSTTQFASVEDIDVIITDDETPPQTVEDIKNSGIEVIVAGKS